MPGFTVTRGLGPGATPSAFIAQGFAFVAEEALRILKGGRSAASRAIKDLTETFKISAMLVKANGKDLISPIINNVRKTFSNNETFTVKVRPKKLVARKSRDLSIKAKLKNKRTNDERN